MDDANKRTTAIEPGDGSLHRTRWRLLDVDRHGCLGLPAYSCTTFASLIIKTIDLLETFLDGSIISRRPGSALEPGFLVRFLADVRITSWKGGRQFTVVGRDSGPKGGSPDGSCSIPGDSGRCGAGEHLVEPGEAQPQGPRAVLPRASGGEGGSRGRAPARPGHGELAEEIRDLRGQVARLQRKIHALQLGGLVPWVDALAKRVEDRFHDEGKAGRG